VFLPKQHLSLRPCLSGAHGRCFLTLLFPGPSFCRDAVYTNVVFATLLASATAFVPASLPTTTARARQQQQARVVSMNASEKSLSDTAGSLMLGLMLATSSVVPLMAGPEPALAARSGGRAGGGRSFRSAPPPRAAAPRMAAPAGAGGRGTTVINNNYRSGYGGGGVMLMPPIISPFGYSPFGGMGTGYALGAMSANGNRQEVYRVENELGRAEAQVGNVEEQLQAEKEKNAALEKRLDAIEAAIPAAQK
jgi:hypothetical protein